MKVLNNTIQNIIFPISRILTVFMVLVTISCSDDDSPSSDPTPDSLTLTFSLETAEDQMGDFACNTMTLFDGKVWSVGGDNAYTPSTDYSSDVWNSSNGAAWASVSNNITGGRCGHSLTSFNGELWLIGGENTSGDWYGDIWKSTDGTNWTNTYVTAPFGSVTYHQTLVFNSKMYIIAGSIITGNTFVWSTADGDTWVEETNNAFSARVSQGAFVFDGAMYVLGGENIAGAKLNEIWRSTNGSNWTLIPNNASVFPGINGHTVTVYNNKIWIIGGRTDTSVYSNTIYSSSNLEDWITYDGLNPLDPIIAHSTLLYNDALWVFGGFTGSGVATGKIWSIKED